MNRTVLWWVFTSCPIPFKLSNLLSYCFDFEGWMVGGTRREALRPQALLPHWTSNFCNKIPMSKRYFCVFRAVAGWNAFLSFPSSSPYLPCAYARNMLLWHLYFCHFPKLSWAHHSFSCMLFTFKLSSASNSFRGVFVLSLWLFTSQRFHTNALF